jgi:hypothetical protein
VNGKRQNSDTVLVFRPQGLNEKQQDCKAKNRRSQIFHSLSPQFQLNSTMFHAGFYHFGAGNSTGI